MIKLNLEKKKKRNTALGVSTLWSKPFDELMKYNTFNYEMYGELYQGQTNILINIMLDQVPMAYIHLTLHIRILFLNIMFRADTQLN